MSDDPERLVWAKFERCPYWPAKIVPNIPPTVLKGKRKPPKNRTSVMFFGTNNYAYVDDQKIKDFDEYKDEMVNACDADDFLEAVKRTEEYIQNKTTATSSKIPAAPIGKSPVVKSEDEEVEGASPIKSRRQPDRLLEELRLMREKYNDAVFRLRQMESNASKKNDDPTFDDLMELLRQKFVSISEERSSLAVSLNVERNILNEAAESTASLSSAEEGKRTEMVAELRKQHSTLQHENLALMEKFYATQKTLTESNLLVESLQQKIGMLTTKATNAANTGAGQEALSEPNMLVSALQRKNRALEEEMNSLKLTNDVNLQKLTDANVLTTHAEQQHMKLEADLEAERKKIGESGQLVAELEQKQRALEDQVELLESAAEADARKLNDADKLVIDTQERIKSLELDKSAASTKLEAEQKKLEDSSKLVTEHQQEIYTLQREIKSLNLTIEHDAQKITVAGASTAGVQHTKTLDRERSVSLAELESIEGSSSLGKRRGVARGESTPKLAKAEYSTPRKSAQNKRSPKTSTKKTPPGKKVSDNFEVEALLGHKRKDSEWYFRVRFKGYSAKDDLWLPEANLDCADILQSYREQHNL